MTADFQRSRDNASRFDSVPNICSAATVFNLVEGGNAGAREECHFAQINNQSATITRAQANLLGEHTGIGDVDLTDNNNANFRRTDPLRREIQSTAC